MARAELAQALRARLPAGQALVVDGEELVVHYRDPGLRQPAESR